MPSHTRTYVFVPKKTKWRWVVLGTAFLCNAINDGIIRSFAIFVVSFKEEFEMNTISVSVINATLFATFYISKPIACGWINRFGFRIVGFFGGVLCVFGYALSSFCLQLPVLVIFSGFVSGIGSGTVSINCFVVVNFYFATYRTAASGIAAIGSCFGAIGVPTILNLMETSCGLKRTIFTMGLLMLIPTVLSLFYLPLMPVKILTDIDLDTAIRKRLARDEEYEDNTERMVFSYCCCKFKRPMVNKLFPTTDQLVSETRMIIPNLGSYLFDTDLLYSLTRKETLVYYIKNFFSYRNVFGESVVRPMYRDDIFYTNSVTTLVKAGSEEMVHPRTVQHLSMHMLLTRAADIDDYKKGSKWFSKPFLRAVRTMLDPSMFLSPSFCCFAFSITLMIFSCVIPLVFMYQRSLNEQDFTQVECISILSAIGVGNAVGAMINVAIHGVSRDRCIMYCAGAFFLCGIATLFSTTTKFPPQLGHFVYTFILGFCSAAIDLRQIVLVRLLGVQHLTNAYGLLLMLMGGSAGLGVLLGGLLRTNSGYHDAGFRVSGSLMIVAAACMLLVLQIKRSEDKFDDEV